MSLPVVLLKIDETTVHLGTEVTGQGHGLSVLSLNVPHHAAAVQPNRAMDTLNLRFPAWKGSSEDQSRFNPSVYLLWYTPCASLRWSFKIDSPL
jgi:hypothetical protein